MTDCDPCETSDEVPQLTNRPGLPAIAYRIRTYATFRQAMLKRIPFEAVEGARPLVHWTARQNDDFGIALIDLWAYIGDILTFYQERISNEAYLRTARHHDSLRRLAALLDYHPRPGAAAVALLAFTLQAPTPASPSTELRPGLRIQSVPGQDEKPQKFETTEARTARYAWNRLTPVTRQPQTLTRGTPSIYLTGHVRSIKVGDALLIVGDERSAAPEDNHWDFRFITQIEYLEDQTRVTFQRPLGAVRRNVSPASTNPRVYVMRRRAALFGFNAPDWTLLPEITKRQILKHNFNVTTQLTRPTAETTIMTTFLSPVPPATALPALPDDWNFEVNPEQANTIDLDALYPTLLVDHWVVLERPTYEELYRVRETTSTARSDYMTTAKITRLRVDTDVNLPSFKAETRATNVYFGQEELPFGSMPADTPFDERSIDVMGDQRGLETGRPIILEGLIGDQVVQKVAYINETQLQDLNTHLIFTDPIVPPYAPETLTVYANVLESTHGERVREILGSGDASQPFQTFTLQKAPVTYVLQAGAPNGVASTLEIRVNDILWTEVRSFYGHGPNDMIYTTQADEKGVRTVRFGDGKTGQRLPTGRGNVTASYRHGLGKQANVAARTLTTLLDRPLGVKSVINPIAAEGGAEAEQAASMRLNAPNTVRTFGRIVSLRDFEDAAREYAGIAKARASIEWDDQGQYVRLTVVGSGGREIRSDLPIYRGLLADLNTRRDPNRRMLLEHHAVVYVKFTANLIIDTPTYIAENVKAAVTATLTHYFAFDQMELGQAVYLSDLYRAIHDIDGVIAVDVEEFHITPRPANTQIVQTVIGVSSRQLIKLEELLIL